MALTKVTGNLIGTETVTNNNISDSVRESFGPRNRIINGDMRIDQRNAGASVTAVDGAYGLDRYRLASSQTSKFSIQQSSTAPTGFVNSLFVTSLSAYSIISSDIFFVQQRIEGTNISDLAWGTASAKTVTLSFWVRSSLTGTFGGGLANSAQDRSYPFTYTISAADTFEYKTVEIEGDTSGTWLTTTGVGVRITFSLGTGSTYSTTADAWAAGDFRSATGAVSVVGTNAATWQITGVQLEVGEVATPFERRPFGTELSLCQRYFEVLGYGCIAMAESGSTYVMNLPYRVTKRSAASIGLTITSNLRLRQFGVADRDAASPSGGSVASSTTGGTFKVSGFAAIGASSTPAGICFTTTSDDGNAFFASAEL